MYQPLKEGQRDYVHVPKPSSFIEKKKEKLPAVDK